MKKITLSFEVLAAIIAVAILQACATTTTTAKCQCAKPTLNPPSASDVAGKLITVRISTTTDGAKLRWTLTGNTPTNGSIPAKTGYVPLRIEVFGRTLTATAYKPGCADSLPAQGIYRPKVIPPTARETNANAR